MRLVQLTDNLIVNVDNVVYFKYELGALYIQYQTSFETIHDEEGRRAFVLLQKMVEHGY